MPIYNSKRTSILSIRFANEFVYLLFLERLRTQIIVMAEGRRTILIFKPFTYIKCPNVSFDCYICCYFLLATELFDFLGRAIKSLLFPSISPLLS